MIDQEPTITINGKPLSHAQEKKGVEKKGSGRKGWASGLAFCRPHFPFFHDTTHSQHGQF